MEDHREKDKRVEEDAMRRFFSSQPTGFICPILNGPCSTMTEAEEIEAELHTRIKELEAQLAAAEAREARLREGLGTIRAISRYEHCRGHIEEVMREANSIIRSLLGEVE